MKSQRVTKQTTYEEFKSQSLEDVDVKREYDALEDEYYLISQLIRLRTAKHMTQSELAQRAGLKQAAIARLESGASNPSYKTLSRVARALDKKVSLV